MHGHPATRSDDLVVGFGTADDAGVLRLPSDRARALVHTVDYFTPIVDDAYDWGRIAAANALSDCYAMGAEPISALQLLGWPRNELPFELAGQVMRGGADVLAEAGCVLVGGHSIDAAEPTYGLAVTGMVDTDRVVTNAGGRPGDRLVLTKPLGSGIVSTALKAGACPDDLRVLATETMAALNRSAALAMTSVGVTAATDVTGFGLCGHLAELCDASRVGAVLEPEAVPFLPGVAELLAAGFYPGGSVRNLEAARPRIDGAVDPDTLRLLCDAQTSGGLLMAVEPEREAALVAGLEERGALAAAVIGQLTAESGRIRLA